MASVYMLESLLPQGTTDACLPVDEVLEVPDFCSLKCHIRQSICSGIYGPLPEVREDA